MRSKTKYFIIALLFAMIALTSVGVSKWNIHIQQQFNNPFGVAHETTTTNPIIGRYIRIQNGNTSVLPGEADLTYNGAAFTVAVTDDGNDGNTNASTWTQWQAAGLSFTYDYYKTKNYNTSGVLVANGTANTKLTGEPQDAGEYRCVITAVTNDSAQDSAKTAKSKLNICNASDGSKCAAEISFIIKPAEITTATITPYKGTYDGQGHGIIVNAPTITTVNSQVATITYTLNGRTYNDVPTIKDAGEYPLTITITAPNHKTWTQTYTGENAAKIDPKKVTVTWHDFDNLTYNGSAQAPTATVKEGDLVSGDIVNVTVTVNGAHTDANADKGGNPLTGKPAYTAVASDLTGEKARNYTLGTTNPTTTFRIKQLPVTVAWGITTFTYNRSAQAPTANVANHVNNDDVSVTVTVEGEHKNVGTYNATASGLNGAKAENYTLTDATNASTGFTITQLPITVIIEDKSSEYGSIVPLTCTTTNSYANSDGLNNIVQLSTTAKVTSNVGSNYTITGEKKNNDTANNYSVTFENGTYTINPRVVELQWTKTSLIYNGSSQVPTANVTNPANGDTISVTVTATGEHKNVGSYTATATELSNTNYTLEGLTQNVLTTSFSITAKPVTLTWSNANNRTYNGESALPTATYTDANGDPQEATVTVTIDNQTVTEVKNAGTYTAKAAISDANYQIDGSATKTFTISQAPLTVKADNKEFSEGNMPENFKFTYSVTSGTIYSGDTINVTYTVTNKATGEVVTVNNNTPAGTYTITPSATHANYDITCQTGTLTVNKGITKPTPNTTVFTYNGSAQTYKPVNFNPDTMNITGNVQINAGTYEVIVTLKDTSATWSGGGSEPLTFTFTINPKPVTINWGDTTFTYNGAEQKPTANATGFIGSDSLTLTIKDSNGNTITEAKNAGSYTAEATFSQNYTTTSETTKSFTIGKKSLTITLSTQKDKITYGESYTTFGITHTLLGLCEQDNADGLITYKLKADNTTLELIDYLDVNSYFVIPQIADTLSQNYKLNYSSCTVTVEPLKIKFDSTVISKGYSPTGIVLSDVFNSSTFAATYEKDANNPKIDVAYSSIASAILRNYADTSTNDVHNVSAGRLKYTLDNTPKKIAGSTYGITLSFSKNNFNNYNYTLTGSNAYLKYLTAIANGGYYTIEDAIAQSGTITLAGNATNETSYIVTAFSKLGLSGGSFASYKTNYNYTLDGKQLVVPFDSSTDYFKGEGSYLPETVYSALVVPQGITLDFINNSKLYVGAFVGTPGGDTKGKATIRTHGVLINNGTINLSSGCEFFSFGYTKSASADSPGIINAQSGVTIKEFMIMYDWPGGNVGMKIADKVFPINRWSLHNISCKLNVYAGATHYAYTAVSMSLVGPGKYCGVEACIIGNNSTNNCLFKPSNNTTSNDYVLKYATGADELYTIDGSNCLETQKDVVYICGSYEDKELSINVSVLGLNVDMRTSDTKSAPLSYMDVIVKSGATLALNKSDYVFMKTAKLEVENGATLNIGSNIDVAFIDNAYAMVNGTVSGSGDIGGLIKTSSAGALLKVNNAATYTIKVNNEASTGNTIQAKGVQTAGGSATTLTTGNYSSVGSPGSYYWVPNDSIKTVTFVLNETGATYTTTVILTNGSYTLQSGDFPTTPTRDHYTFGGWFTGTNGTGTEVSATLNSTITGDITLYAKWTPDTYTITYLYVGDNGTQLTQEQLNTITNPANNTTDNYSYGSGFTLPVPISTNTNMQFVGWYSDSACTQTITAISDTDFGNLTLYGKWTAETPKNYNITLRSDKTGVTLATSTLSVPGTVESGANTKIPAINATWASKTAVLNQEFMNSTNFSIIKAEGHYNFDSYFIGWSLTYTLNGSTSSVTYNEATPQIEIPAGATDITLKTLWEQKAILNFSFITTKNVVLKTTTKYFSPNMSFSSTLIETLLTAFATSGESTEAFTHYQFDYYYVGDDNTTQNQAVNFTSPGQSVTLHAVYRRDYLIKVAGNNITLTNPDGVYVDWKTTPTEYNVSALFSINQGYYDVPADVTANHGTVTYNAEDAKYYLNLTGVDSADDVTVTIVTKELVKIAFTINGAEISSLTQYRKPGDTVNFANISHTQATDYDITSNAQYFTGKWTLNGVTYSATGNNTVYTVGESNATFVAVLDNKATVQITMKSQGSLFSGYQTAECNFKYKKEDDSFGTEYCKYKYKVLGGEGKEKWTFYLNPEQTFTIEPKNDSTINTPANDVTPVAGQTHSYTVTSKK